MRVPIVAGAVIFDLAVGDPEAFPDAEMGEAACRAATGGPVEAGAVGAGTGATVGKLLGVGRSSAGGVGTAAVSLGPGATVAALAVVNAFGDVVDPESGDLLAGPRGEAGPLRTATALMEGSLIAPPAAGGNTTLVCVVTDVPFEPGSLKRVAIEAHDGIARAVRPSHSVVDGDVVFALSPGGAAPDVPTRLRVGAAAAEAAARAIVAAVRPG